MALSQVSSLVPILAASLVESVKWRASIASGPSGFRSAIARKRRENWVSGSGLSK